MGLRGLLGQEVPFVRSTPTRDGRHTSPPQRCPFLHSNGVCLGAEKKLSEGGTGTNLTTMTGTNLTLTVLQYVSECLCASMHKVATR